MSLSVGNAVEHVRSKLARRDTGHHWSNSNEIGVACYKASLEAFKEISPRKRPFGAQNPEHAGKEFRERERSIKTFTDAQLRIIERVLNVRSGFFDTAFASYEELGAAYELAKISNQTKRQSFQDGADHIGTDCVDFNHEVRAADMNDVASIFKLSTYIFPQEILFDERKVSGWVREGHYRVLIENDQSASTAAVIGYYGIWSLPRLAYEWVRDHPGREKELSLRKACRLDSDELYGLYIFDLIGPKDRSMAKALCIDLALYVNLLCSRHRRIEKIGASAYSKAGRILCGDLGLVRIKGDFFQIDRNRIIDKTKLPRVAQYILRRSFQERYFLP